MANAVKKKKVPVRLCLATMQPFPKKEMFRVVRTPEQNVILDETGKANGRGAYLKKDAAVIKKAKASKLLDKVLEVEVPVSIYDELYELIK